ncbi:hypothetical protein BGZ99_006073 [Dissophora globulifera]|uniref:Uncharacterized protein n=1 Tax=Dissophora globulifera TaxID=979702 RepID=A0A9P6RFG2_9FUNG|nr:hypothetical protein BGZ99_006073 [Dissophora globulifera]
MFLPISIFILNVILAVLQFSLLSAVAAILAIYSRFGGEYANSIRWIQQYGYMEMFSSLFRSSRRVPAYAKFALLITIIVTIAASLADKGAAVFVHSSIQLKNVGTFLATSPQFVQASEQERFSGWSGSLRYGDDIVRSMALLINDTTNIPGAVPGQFYEPLASPYNVGCQQFDIGFDNDTELVRIRNNGCATMELIFDGPFYTDFTGIQVRNVSKGRWSLSGPGALTETSFSSSKPFMQPILSSERVSCRILDKSWVVLATGVSSLPKTSSTRCVTKNGTVAVLTQTATAFNVFQKEDFGNITTGMFDGHDSQVSDLFDAMDASIKSTTFPTSPSNLTVLMEIKSDAQYLDFLGCYSHPQLNSTELNCVYSHIHGFILEQQDLDPVFDGLPKSMDYTALSVFGSLMVFQNLPNLINGSPQLIPMATMRDISAKASQYQASLGQNYVSDYGANAIYTQYTVTTAKQGIEMPDWLPWTIVGLVGGCVLLCLGTFVFLDGQYTSSLYSLIGHQLATEYETPRGLMKAKLNPVILGGVPVASRAYIPEKTALIGGRV